MAKTEAEKLERPPADICGFNEAWIGNCKELASKDGRCAKHQLVCCSCGAIATHSCEETGMFVCGAPLCDDCEHTIFPEGHNGGVGFNQQPCPEGMKRYVRKSEQVYKPWYTRGEADKQLIGG